mmetsp:Transcript_71360/g.159779  ORF Transcript_71360/g.159779 Transcript_71360/m.159779 type:complete len:274 (+) Transcript_71360:129-950(+)
MVISASCSSVLGVLRGLLCPKGVALSRLPFELPVGLGEVLDGCLLSLPVRLAALRVVERAADVGDEQQVVFVKIAHGFQDTSVAVEGLRCYIHQRRCVPSHRGRREELVHQLGHPRLMAVDHHEHLLDLLVDVPIGHGAVEVDRSRVEVVPAAVPEHLDLLHPVVVLCNVSVLGVVHEALLEEAHQLLRPLEAVLDQGTTALKRVLEVPTGVCHARRAERRQVPQGRVAGEDPELPTILLGDRLRVDAKMLICRLQIVLGEPISCVEVVQVVE